MMINIANVRSPLLRAVFSILAISDDLLPQGIEVAV